MQILFQFHIHVCNYGTYTKVCFSVQQRWRAHAVSVWRAGPYKAGGNRKDRNGYSKCKYTPYWMLETERFTVNEDFTHSHLLTTMNEK